MAGSKIHRGLRRITAAVVAITIGVTTAFISYNTSVQPGAALVRAVFEARPEVTPPTNFTAVAEEVQTLPSVKIDGPRFPPARVRLYAPKAPSPTPRPIILWVHGGGFVSSSAATVEDYAILLARAGYVVASLDYSLAPKARHPVPVRQAVAALNYLSANAARYGADPTRVFIGGDSAGAQIASETGTALTDPTIAAALHTRPTVARSDLAGVILFCGLYNMTTVADSGFPALRTYLWAYTGQRDWTHYAQANLMSPARTASSDYPRTFVSVGDADPFEAQGQELAAHLENVGVPVTKLFWRGQGLGHEYQFDFTTRSAQQALKATLKFLKETRE